MVHYNAYITGEYSALYTPTNHAFFIVQMMFWDLRLPPQQILWFHYHSQSGDWIPRQEEDMAKTLQDLLPSVDIHTRSIQNKHEPRKKKNNLITFH